MTNQDRHIPRGVWRLCAGMVEADQILPPRYRHAVRMAESAIGEGLDPQVRRTLTEAVKLNLISCRDWPFELLRRRYGLPLGHNAFGREKYNFCRALARELGIL